MAMDKNFLSDLSVNILSVPSDEDWLISKKLAYRTIGKETEKQPDEQWKRMILGAEHSPIRNLIVRWEWINLPYWVSVHFVRHKIGIEHYVRSQRNDRQSEYDRNKAPQDAPVTHSCVANIQEIINISKVRLCKQASYETRYAWAMFLGELMNHMPEVPDFCQPTCIYRNGICPEPRGCGFNKTSQFNKLSDAYKLLFDKE